MDFGARPHFVGFSDKGGDALRIAQVAGFIEFLNHKEGYP
jgi:hypothetical protein